MVEEEDVFMLKFTEKLCNKHRHLSLQDALSIATVSP